MTPQRVTLITLGVQDLERAKKFYLALGWSTHPRSLDNIIFFQMNGLALGLFETSDLAKDQGRNSNKLGTGRITLAQGYSTEQEVDSVFARALASGATEIKKPQKAEWGGYSGYYADPDEHVWEVAVNPNWPLNDDGSLTLPLPN